MSLDAYVDEERNYVIVTIKGDFTIKDIVRMITRAVNNPKCRPGFSILSDHTEVGTPITTEQVKGLMKHLSSLSDKMAGVRWAAFTTKPASFGMMRMVSTMAESVPMEVEVFSTKEEAENWLSTSKASDT